MRQTCIHICMGTVIMAACARVVAVLSMLVIFGDLRHTFHNQAETCNSFELMQRAA